MAKTAAKQETDPLHDDAVLTTLVEHAQPKLTRVPPQAAPIPQTKPLKADSGWHVLSPRKMLQTFLGRPSDIIKE